MRRIVLSSMASPAVPLSHKRYDFREGGRAIEGKMCFDFHHNFCLKCYSYSEEMRDISLIGDRSVTTQNLAFFRYWYTKKRSQMHL